MKRTLCILLALCVMLTTFCGAASVTDFKDVSPSFWAFDEISWSVEKGLMNGTSRTTFAPNGKTLRGQMTAILYRYAGSPAVEGGSPYSDVEPGQYFADASVWARNDGILISDRLEASTLGPNDVISRAEFCTMLYRFASASGRDVSKTSAVPFTDTGSLSWELQTAIAWAYGSGIIDGMSASVFAPDDSLTRAQAVVMLYRYEVAEDDDIGEDPAPSVSPTTAAFMAEVVRLTNLEREKAGLPALRTFSALTEAAQLRANELTTLFSHTRPDGSRCFTVLDDIGFWAAGENIARGQSTPEQVVTGWMNSEGHRANILNVCYTAIGVGYVDRHWVQLFIGD